jgi:hypothetical protein
MSHPYWISRKGSIFFQKYIFIHGGSSQQGRASNTGGS